MNGLNCQHVTIAIVRREVLVLPVLAILIYIFRVEIIGLIGIDLGQATFLGVPLVTDWASIGLLLIFALELAVSIYGNFFSGPKLEFTIRDEDREFAKNPIPVTATFGNTGIGKVVRLLVVRVGNKGPQIAEGCHAYCKVLRQEGKFPIEIRWRMRREAEVLRTVPVVKMERIPMEIQEWFETGPVDIIPNVMGILAVACAIDGVGKEAYLISAGLDAEPLPLKTDVQITVVGKNVRRPLVGKFRMCLDSSSETGIEKLKVLERLRSSILD
jgi:hypothetical protein